MIKKILTLIFLISTFIAVLAIQVFAKEDIKPLPKKIILSQKSPSPTPIPTVIPTAILTPTPITVPVVSDQASKFITLSIGSSLPSDGECSSRVKRSSFEPRPENNVANNSVAAGGPYIGDVFKPERITGNFTGTTDEVLQWGACKWGFDEDVVRAVAVQESYWRMSAVGDNGESFGILQVRKPIHTNTYPASKDSTAFNVDYALSYRRACFEGQHTWMKQKNPGYTSGDEWGCVGSWFSGNWYNEGAYQYIEKVKNHSSSKTWLKEGF